MMRRLSLVPAALITVLLIGAAAGCSTAARPGTAAVADGTSYSVSEVDAIARQLAPLTQSGSDADAAGQAIPLLVIGEDVRRLSREFGAPVLSDDDVRAQLAPQLEQAGVDVADFDADTLDVLATVLMAGSLRATPEGDQAVTELLTDLEIDVNPRYGSASTTEAGDFVIGPAQEEWLATPAPGTEPGAPAAP